MLTEIKKHDTLNRSKKTLCVSISSFLLATVAMGLAFFSSSILCHHNAEFALAGLFLVAAAGGWLFWKTPDDLVALGGEGWGWNIARALHFLLAMAVLIVMSIFGMVTVMQACSLGEGDVPVTFWETMNAFTAIVGWFVAVIATFVNFHTLAAPQPPEPAKEE